MEIVVPTDLVWIDAIMLKMTGCIAAARDAFQIIQCIFTSCDTWSMAGISGVCSAFETMIREKKIT